MRLHTQAESEFYAQSTVHRQTYLYSSSNLLYNLIGWVLSFDQAENEPFFLLCSTFNDSNG
jgi:hypothetical protein